MLERELVSESVRRAAEDRGLAEGVQRGAATQQSGVSLARRVCGNTAKQRGPWKRQSEIRTWKSLRDFHFSIAPATAVHPYPRKFLSRKTGTAAKETSYDLVRKLWGLVSSSLPEKCDERGCLALIAGPPDRRDESSCQRSAGEEEAYKRQRRDSRVSRQYSWDCPAEQTGEQNNQSALRLTDYDILPAGRTPQRKDGR